MSWSSGSQEVCRELRLQAVGDALQAGRSEGRQSMASSAAW